MTFAQQKKDVLSKEDKSSKGSWDTPIIPLLDRINALDQYYTTSSCSGRIALLVKEQTKLDSDWLFVSHDPINTEQLREALEKVSSSQNVWLFFEAPIMHIACQHIDDGLALVELARDVGFRHAGIIGSSEKKTMVELIGAERFDIPASLVKDALLKKGVLEKVVSLVNEKLEKSHEDLKKLQKKIEKLSSTEPQ